MAARGRFITLEGGEGAGKSTQAALLAERLRQDGREVVLTREPGGSPGADILRRLLLSGEHDWARLAEVLLHFASRAEHLDRVIVPALDRGAWVVCDRFSDSTMVYQGWGLGADRAAITTLIGMMGLVPDLTLVLDVSVETTLRRLADRGDALDRYERLGAPFFARIREGFLSVAEAHPDRCVVLSGETAVNQLTTEIDAILRARLPS